MLTDAWFPLRYHPQQDQAWRTKARMVALAAGRGSGKTELARRRVVRFLPVKKPWSNPMYFYALPTYKQAKRVAWRPICRLIPREWLKGEPNESEMRIDTIFGSSLYIVGMDKPQRLEGDQWDGGVIDESCDQKPGSFDRSVAPALTHRNGWCWRIGVPKRSGVGAHDFRAFFEKGAEESYTWSSEDILSPEQLEYFRNALDEKDYNEQFRASWETMSGLVHHAFDPVFNVRDELTYHEGLPLIVGSDFNVDPMCWVVCQQSLNKKELYVIDEVYLRNTNTSDTLTYLHARYQEHHGGWDFFGDASGRARNTRASASDYIQIKNDSRFIGSRVHYPRSNPARANRFAAVNAAFKSTAGVRRVFIHPRCKNLIRDLTTRAYKAGTTEPDDYGDVGHITDALGYVIHSLYPLSLEIHVTPEVSIHG